MCRSYAERRGNWHFIILFLISVQTLFYSLSVFACAVHTKCMHLACFIKGKKGKHVQGNPWLFQSFLEY